MFDNYVYLYVEDDLLSRQVMKMNMEMVLGVKRFTIFENSENFMARVHALPEKPDVILLDIHMEPHNGFEMLEMLRDDPDYCHLSVIALTASVMNEEVDRLKTSGFDGAIGKPLDVQVFPELLRRVLNHETVWHIV